MKTYIKERQDETPLQSHDESRRGFLLKGITGTMGTVLFLVNGFRLLATNHQENLYYSSHHIWVKTTNKAYTIGVTNHLQEALGKISCVELPRAGQDYIANQKFGLMASMKIFDLLMPLSGKVTKVNEQLWSNPELINNDAYGKGWLIQIRLNAKGQRQSLMNIPAYEEFIKLQPTVKVYKPAFGSGADTPYVVTEPCVGCKYTDCAFVCPVHAFHELPDRVYINPQTCISCNACMPECPVEAVFPLDRVPEEWNKWIGLNTEAEKHPIICCKRPPLRDCSKSLPKLIGILRTMLV
jgi:glycine cleavage system H protein